MSSTVLRCELGDVPVSEGILTLPLRGNWSATMKLGFERAPTEGAPATLVFNRENGAADLFVGVLRRSGFLPGSQTVSVTLVGGAGKLLDDVLGRDHVAGSTTLPAGLIARSIVDDAGEVLAAGVELALDALTVPRWTRIATSARDALDMLVDRLGLGWRVLADGTIWVGVETWPPQNNLAFYAGGEPADGMTLYAPDGAPLVVGSTIDGARAVSIDYSIGSGVRAQVRTGVAGDPPRAIDLTAYRTIYPATVKAQNADGTLALTADDPDVGLNGDLLNVPFRIGVPGAIATIPAGARVRVVFEGADPRGAYAAALDQDTADETTPFALVGDAVDCGWYTANAPPGGGPVVVASVSEGTPNAFHVTGSVTGPGHKYLKGVSA